MRLTALGGGQDTILEFDDSEAGQSSQDRVSFSDSIFFDDVSFSRRANGDLSVNVAGLSDAITVSGWYNDPANRVESFVFADGQTVTADTLSALPITPQSGSDGNDIFGQYRNWRYNMAKKQYKFHKSVDAEKIARQNHMSRQLIYRTRAYSSRFSI